MTESISDKAVYRTAPATPGLLITVIGGMSSQAQSTLSLEKPAMVNNKNMTPQKFSPEITASVIAFKISFTLDIKIVYFCRRVAVCIKKRHKNAILWCSPKV